MNKHNGVRRSIARGAKATTYNQINSHGKDSTNQARKSYKGHYSLSFSETLYKVTEKDIELKYTYGKDLVAGYMGVPIDMIYLKVKKSSSTQTLTSLDEVYYVKVGQYTVGKLSIRTQRTWKSANLTFVFQEKKVGVHNSKHSKRGGKKVSKSQSNRKTYNYGKKGTY